MNFNSASRRYSEDPEFRRLVDTLTSFIEHLQFTGSDLKEAAIYATILFELRHPKPLVFYPGEITPEMLEQIRKAK